SHGKVAGTEAPRLWVYSQRSVEKKPRKGEEGAGNSRLAHHQNQRRWLQNRRCLITNQSRVMPARAFSTLFDVPETLLLGLVQTYQFGDPPWCVPPHLPFGRPLLQWGRGR